MCKYVFLLIIFFVSSEVSSAELPLMRLPSTGDTPKLRRPTTNKLVQINKTIAVSKTFDCKGATYRWTGSGDCSQKEGMPPMFKLMRGATLKNCFIERAPDGIHIKGSNVTIDNIVMPDVCEDAVSASSNSNYTNIKIINSQFARCEDKCLQFNPTSVKKVLIENNDFIDGQSCIRFKRGSELTVRNNRFYKCKRALFHSEGSATLNVSGNKFQSVQEKLRKTSDLKVNGKL